jgi:hypothetical protein
MANKKTLNQKIDALTNIVEKGFAAVAEDIAGIKRDMATKDQVIALHTQVNSIERQLRDTNTEIRLSDSKKKYLAKPAASHRATTTHQSTAIAPLRDRDRQVHPRHSRDRPSPSWCLKSIFQSCVLNVRATASDSSW